MMSEVIVFDILSSDLKKVKNFNNNRYLKCLLEHQDHPQSVSFKEHVA